MLTLDGKATAWTAVRLPAAPAAALAPAGSFEGELMSPPAAWYRESLAEGEPHAPTMDAVDPCTGDCTVVEDTLPVWDFRQSTATQPPCST